MDDDVQYIAVFLIGAKDPVKEFQERANHLVESSTITREEIPKLLDRVCKLRGNAGEIAREIRKKLRG